MSTYIPAPPVLSDTYITFVCIKSCWRLRFLVNKHAKQYFIFVSFVYWRFNLIELKINSKCTFWPPNILATSLCRPLISHACIICAGPCMVQGESSVGAKDICTINVRTMFAQMLENSFREVPVYRTMDFYLCIAQGIVTPSWLNCSQCSLTPWVPCSQ